MNEEKKIKKDPAHIFVKNALEFDFPEHLEAERVRKETAIKSTITMLNSLSAQSGKPIETDRVEVKNKSGGTSKWGKKGTVNHIQYRENDITVLPSRAAVSLSRIITEAGEEPLLQGILSKEQVGSRWEAR